MRRASTSSTTWGWVSRSRPSPTSMAFQASGFRAPAELGSPDLAAMDFLYELGEIAAAGDDIHGRLFS